jgi:catechol 2,3-dioxygenase-like lactoylglutathione lyase family enzyme
LTRPVSSLIRAALFVQDLDRASAFYSALGLREIYFEGGLDGPSSAATLHIPANTKVRCRILKRQGAANYGMIGLFELLDPAPAPLPAAQSITPRNGEVALVFYVTDIERALQNAFDLGARLVAPWTQFQMPHRAQREACLRDPDGVLINLIERPPEEQFETGDALTIAAKLMPQA